MRELLQYFLKTPDGLTNEEVREHLFFRIGYPNAAGVHFFYSVVFALNDITWLAWYNIAVAAAFSLGAVFWNRFESPLWVFIPLWLIEIPFHAFLGTITVGVLSMFWVVPIASAVPCLLIPSLSWPIRILLASSLTVFSGGLFSMGFIFHPTTPLPTFSAFALFLCNFQILAALIVYVGLVQRVVQVAEARQQEEFERAEGLLLNILPSSVAERLKDGARVIADNHKDVSVVFADIVDFTAASSKLSPAQLVETLNLVFSEFDKISDRHGAEKIKTIGDAYMVVVGVPDERRNHAEAAVDLACEMQQAATYLSLQTHFEVKLRVGVNSGPVVAGVIGQRKFAYDLWGDAVNVASRMESHGAPGTILITEATAVLLPDRYTVVPEGFREVKGKGSMPVFSVGPTSKP